MKKFLIICLTMASFISSAVAQTHNYSGVVVDNSGVALLGVTVVIEGTTVGTATDMDGKFSIQAASGKSLVFSYLGFETQKVVLAAKDQLRVVLQNETVSVDEVVVTGYIAQKRSDISTAVASLNMAQVAKSGASQVLEAMQGQMSGVQIIQDDGSPAGAMSIRIRGTNSLTGGIQPLIVIDGVPQPVYSSSDDEDGGTNPLAGINMDDIESMEVLKDAAAASIYGADGSNGVIIITTKTGQIGKAKFSINIRKGVNIVPQSPYELQSPEEYARRMNYVNSDNKSWANIVENATWTDPNNWTDWHDLITQNGQRTDVSASMSGGSDKSTYMLSTGYQYNEGLIITNDFSRFNMRLNLTQKVGKSGKLSGLFNYSNTIENNPQQDGLYLKSLYTDPWLGKRELDLENEDNMDTDEYDWRNPLNNIEDGSTTKKTNDIGGQLRYEQNIAKGLAFTVSGSASKRFYDYTQVMGSTTNVGRKSHGQLTLKNDASTNWMGLAQLRYNKRIKKDHNISAFIAYEMKSYEVDQYSMIATGFSDLLLGEYSLASALDIDVPTLYYQNNQTMSVLGRVSYNYKDRYLLNASLRRDGSSKFGSSNKFATFPSLSLAWRVEQEDFLKDIKEISSLKVRASYGETGNNQIPVYLSQPIMSTGHVGIGDDVLNTTTQSRIQNDDLKWETSREYNTGIDLSMFKNRLSITADYYNKTISDMLLETVPPQSSGFATIWRNAGEMRNSGFEFALTARPVVTKDFKWTSNFNISFNNNEVLALADDQYEQYYDSGAGFGNDVLLRVGMPVGIYYGYVADGVYNTPEELENSAEDSNKYAPDYIGDGSGTGRMRIVDTNHDGVINEDDRVAIADVNPDHYGGWGNTLNYKNWELYTFFRWSYGNDQINANLKELGNVGSTSNNVIQDLYENSWTPENPHNNYVTALEVNNPYASVLTSNMVEDGSFIRFQTLRLTYTVPESIVSKLKFSKLNCSFTASNIAIWTKYSGLDPEASNGKGTAKNIAPLLDKSAYPRPLTLLLSIDVGF